MSVSVGVPFTIRVQASAGNVDTELEFDPTPFLAAVGHHSNPKDVVLVSGSSPIVTYDGRKVKLTYPAAAGNTSVNLVAIMDY